MQRIYLSQELGNKIKQFRSEHKVKSKDVARAIDKSPAYISKLEKGEIKQIDKSEFVKMINYIEGTDQGYEIFCESIFSHIDDKKVEHRALLKNFDWTERMLPVREELLKYLQDKFDRLDISCEELVNYINSNEDLKINLRKKNDLDLVNGPFNTWIPYHEADSMSVSRFYLISKFTLNDFEEIFVNKEKKATYLKIYTILYHLNKLEYKKKNKIEILDESLQRNIDKKTEKKLVEFKFYTMEIRADLLSHAENEIDFENALSSFDNRNNKLVSQLLDSLNVISEMDVDYTNTKLTAVIENIDQAGMSFLLAYMALPLKKLGEVSYNKKREFIKAIEDLIELYSNADTENEIEKF